MSSILPVFEYDIFISYRQKDNKYDGWVKEFVDNLMRELGSTFKEEVSVYFDINPHDGLLETHDVDASLKDKLKCLIFIPILSRTYCDPKSFAWDHEFKAFVDQASQDQFGMKVKLPHGNVANRVLPVRIHDLDNTDIKLCESMLGGALRSVDFIYKEPGVNRPLTPSDEENRNLNSTRYRNQINKVALAIKEIISGMNNQPAKPEPRQKELFLIEDNPVIREKSIIVLPFENMSPDPDQEYFSDGLTEEIISDLSQIRDLLVISRSSAMTFKGSNKKISEIAREVNVRYVLEGSVRKAGNNLRITAQLIDAESDSHQWAEKYNGVLDNIFDIQEKVSRSIADSLKLKLSPEEARKFTEHTVNNLQAYQCYLKARQDLWKYTEESLRRAEQNLMNGLNILGENEILYSGLGQVYFTFYDIGIDQSQGNLNKLEECIRKMFRLNPDSSSAHLLSGLLKLKTENAIIAYKNFKRSYEINPAYPEASMWLIYIQCYHLGQPTVAAPLIKKLLEIDPLTPVNQCSAGWGHWMAGRFDLALKSMIKWYGMEPDSLVAGWYLAILKAWNRDYEGTYVLIDQVCRNYPEHILSKFLLLFKYCLQKKREEALPLFTEELRQVGWNDFGLGWNIADCYALIDEKEESIKWLERSVEWGLINYPLLSKQDPFLENIRGEGRFIRLMERVKYEWENFEI